MEEAHRRVWTSHKGEVSAYLLKDLTVLGEHMYQKLGFIQQCEKTVDVYAYFFCYAYTHTASRITKDMGKQYEDIHFRLFFFKRTVYNLCLLGSLPEKFSQSVSQLVSQHLPSFWSQNTHGNINQTMSVMVLVVVVVWV